MVDLSPWQRQDPLARSEARTCPQSDTWAHADIAESLAMPIGTLLHDQDGLYCPACDYRPEQDEAAR